MSKSKFTSREFRKYLYGIAITAIPFAVYFEWITPEASLLIIPLLVAVLNLTPEDANDTAATLAAIEAVRVAPVGQQFPTAGSVAIVPADPSPDDGLDSVDGINAPVVSDEGVELDAADSEYVPRHAA